MGLVGWRQPRDPEADVLDTDLTQSDSGMYFNDQHPTLTYNALKGIAEDVNNFVYDTFDDTKTDYQTGDIVDNGSGLFYIALTDNPAADTLTNTSNWKRYYPFNVWLREKTEAGILQAIEDWYSKKSKLRTSKTIINSNWLWKNNYGFTVENHSDKVTVGYEVKPVDAVLKVDRIRFQAPSPGVNLKISVLQEGVSPAIYTVDEPMSNSRIELDVDWTFVPGKIYLIYMITSTYVNGFINNTTQGSKNEISYRTSSKITPMYTNAFGLHLIEGTNFGLNLNFTELCDYTTFIVDQKDLFKTLIAKRVALNLLSDFIYNAESRVNRNAQTIGYSSQRLTYDLDGDAQSTRGNNNSLNSQYADALNAIQFDRSQINNKCLPCSKRGVKYKAV